MRVEAILKSLPYTAPFLFVDELLEVNAESSKGKYTFHADLPFYEGHFVGNPVTPGAVLTECCAQIGVVCLGIYLLEGQFDKESQIALTHSEMDFLLPVFPNGTVLVQSEKVYFRFNKLKCKVKMFNEDQQVVCRGTISGILKPNNGQ